MSYAFLLGVLQEVHILHDYEIDFYGNDAAIVVLGFIRPEMKFSSLGQFRLLIFCCSKACRVQISVLLKFESVINWF